MFLGENFLFVENPKTGSTSMQNALLAAGLGETILNKHEYITTSVDRQYRRRWRMVCVRNPWDRMVSAFHHCNRSAEPEKWGGLFEQWVLGDKWELTPGIDFKRTPQSLWYWKTNAIIRFENMAEDFPAQMHKMGHHNVTLPHDNKAKIRNGYRHYYTEKTREVVRDRFLPDILKYGYNF